jgi:hypothetical protein
MTMKIVNGNPTYDNASEYDNAYADWHQTGFELSLMRSSESPADYKEMMDSHMAQQPVMTEDVFFGYDPADIRDFNVEGCEEIPF